MLTTVKVIYHWSPYKDIILLLALVLQAVYCILVTHLLCNKMLYPSISLIYNSHFFPFISWWALRLPPYLGHYKKYCSEDRSAYIFLN